MAIVQRFKWAEGLVAALGRGTLFVALTGICPQVPCAGVTDHGQSQQLVGVPLVAGSQGAGAQPLAHLSRRPQESTRIESTP